jgi:hypothetical protein
MAHPSTRHQEPEDRPAVHPEHGAMQPDPELLEVPQGASRLGALPLQVWQTPARLQALEAIQVIEGDHEGEVDDSLRQPQPPGHQGRIQIRPPEPPPGWHPPA